MRTCRRAGADDAEEDGAEIVAGAVPDGTGPRKGRTFDDAVEARCAWDAGAAMGDVGRVVTPRVARGVLGIPAALILRGAVLQDRSSRSDLPQNGGVYAPFLEVDGVGVEPEEVSGSGFGHAAVGIEQQGFIGPGGLGFGARTERITALLKARRDREGGRVGMA